MACMGMQVGIQELVCAVLCSALYCQQIVDACTAGSHDSIFSKSHCPHPPPNPQPIVSLSSVWHAPGYRLARMAESALTIAATLFATGRKTRSKARKTHSKAGPRLAEPVTDSATFSPAMGDWQNVKQGLPHVSSSRALSGALP
jgi:hypothetical protein